MSQRLLRVRELLKREIGQLVTRDYDFTALVTVNSVDAAPDLRTATVYIGVLGEQSEARKIVARLNRDHGAIQRQISKRVVLKFTPQLRFEFDDSVERGVRTVTLLQELEIQDAAAAAARGDNDSTDEDTEVPNDA
jgi:ribosome-binding factor A